MSQMVLGITVRTARALMPALMILGVAVLVVLSASGVRAAPAPMTEVEIRATAEGVRVTWRLSKAVERFEFATNAGGVRKPSWRMLTEGLTLEETAVVAAKGSKFDRFEVVLPSDDRTLVARYPSAVAQGPGGWVLYAPYLLGAAGETRLKARLARGEVVLAGGENRARDGLPTDSLLYIGPRNYVREGRVRLVIAPDVAPWLVQQIENDMLDVEQFYERQFGVGLSSRPLVMVSQHRSFEGGRDWVGDVAPGGVASLRFKGPGWDAKNASMASDLSRFIFHEAAHFWNGGEFSGTEGDPRWLHEGSADYAALLAAVALGRMEPDGFLAEMSSRLSRCAQPTTPADWSTRTGWLPYTCGSVAHWVVDLELRASSGGVTTFWTRWRDMFAEAATRNRVYSLSAYLGRESLARSRALAAVQPRGGAEGWAELIGHLPTLGVKVERAPASDAKLRQDMMFHLLDMDCGTGTFGFYGQDDSLRMDAPATCKSFRPDMEIDAVEGRSLMTAVSPAWEAVTTLCAKGERLQFTRKGIIVLTVPCTIAMPPAPAEWRIISAPNP